MEIKEIEHLAELSKLKFTQEELEDFAKDFESLVELADVVKNADIQGVRQINIVDMNLLREDIPQPSTPAEVLLQNAPHCQKNSFAVPRIME